MVPPPLDHISADEFGDFLEGITLHQFSLYPAFYLDLPRIEGEGFQIGCQVFPVIYRCQFLCCGLLEDIAGETFSLSAFLEVEIVISKKKGVEVEFNPAVDSCFLLTQILFRSVELEDIPVGILDLAYSFHAFSVLRTSRVLEMRISFSTYVCPPIVESD